jgi:hypothetical protein
MLSDFLEKTLEDIIYNYSHKIHEQGFCEFYLNKERQFRLPSGRIIDILTWEIKGDVLYFKIIELKRGCCDEAAFWQGLAYLNEFVAYIYPHFSNIRSKIILCGRSISENIENLLMVTGHAHAYVYKYAYDGIRFSTNQTGNKSGIDQYSEEQMTKIPLTHSSSFGIELSEKLRYPYLESEIAKLKGRK